MNYKKFFQDTRHLQIGTVIILVVFTSSFLTLESARSVQDNHIFSEEAGSSFPSSSIRESATIDDPFMGEGNAPVTIVMYADLKCGMAAYAWQDIIPLIQEQYISEGVVKIVFKDYPLGFATQEVRFAEAAHCAQEQGKYVEFISHIYDDHDVTLEQLPEVAAELGLDVAAFTACFESRKYEAKVREGFDEGESLGVEGTPWFFVNGQEIAGAQDYSVFEEKIEEELQKVS